jgi:class 3 adenylate cyclase/TolB-like protein/cytochrome c-type biogenesis protein CcmH/NrfG
MQPSRRLAAILFTDIVGSTAMMQKDEQAALLINKRYVAVLKQFVSSHGGEILNDFGDGSLCTFASATQAVKCAIEMQQQFQFEPKVPLRIGLHVGEIFFEDGKVFGDGVNVASRIQSLGIANSILFSSQINSQIRNQQEFKSVTVGKFEFKNVDEPMEVFALSKEGLIVPRKEEMKGKLKEIEKKSARRKWALTAIVILLLAGSYFIYQNFFKAPGFSGEKTIAVLPFENIGAPDSEEYISDGITQDIINSLSKISSLQKVIAWFSVRGFKKTTKSLKQIADDLGVTAILSGNIEKHEGKIHIIAELIEVSTNKRLWGDDFEYDGKEILSIQSRVAEEIIAALKVNLSPEEKKNLTRNYTDNPEAYRLYRKGRWFWDKRSKESYDSAEANYKRALELDPDYALAYAGLADCYTFNQPVLSQIEAISIARDYTNKALMLDSTLTEALTTKAFIQSHFDYDWKGAEAAFKKIISDNPNYPIAHLYYGNVLMWTGNSDAAINETKKALALDPLSSVLNMVLGRDYYDARNYDQAIAQLQKTITLSPNFNSSYWHLGNTFLQKKMYSEAIDAYSKLAPGNFDFGLTGMILLSQAYSVSGDKRKAKDEFQKISKEDYLKIDPVLVAEFYISQGNIDEALDQLERGFDSHSIMMVGLKIEPFLDPIRNEPRFKALMKKMNLD